MSKSEMFKKKLKHRELIWGVLFITTLAFFIFLAGWLLTSTINLTFSADPVGFTIITFLISVPVGMACSLITLRPIESWLRKTWLKGYWIEDCGDVIKLHGSVGLSDIQSAYRALLSVRKGYKIAENPTEIYGCTLAAVIATERDLKAKKEMESFGLKIRTIG